MNRTLRKLLWITTLSTLAAGNALAEHVRIANAWVRATVPGQTVAGAYMQISASDSARLIAATSPRAPRVELHETRMDGNMMRMRPAGALRLTRGEVVTLKPGGLHFMLVNLARPIREGEAIPLELVVERNGKRETIAVVATARGVGARHEEHAH